MQDVFLVVLILGLCLFSIWFSILSNRLAAALGALDSSADQLDIIEENIELVARVLDRLPELMPQFHMNNSPAETFKPLVEKIAEAIFGNPEPSIASNVARGSDGQYYAPKEIQIEDTTPTSEANG
jgi:hypothetical protein